MNLTKYNSHLTHQRNEKDYECCRHSNMLIRNGMDCCKLFQ